MNKKRKKSQKQRKQAKHILVAAAAFVLLAIAMTVYIVVRPPESMASKHLVTFYDRGTQTAIVTRAQTVRQALGAADISVDAHDIVEPTIDSTFTTPYVDVIIYRSRPVAVIDGATRRTVMTTAQSPNEILKAAGLKQLGRKDKTTFRAGNIVTDGAFTVLTVARTELKPKPVVFIPRPDALTKSKGAQVFVDSNGVAHRETYYDLPMNIVIGTCGPGGSYHIRSDGAKVDQNGYVLVAANLAAYPRCTIVQTSLGPGKVYDTGGFAARHPYGFDLATDWTNYDGR